MDYREHKAKLMQNPRFREAWWSLRQEYRWRRLLIKARLHREKHGSPADNLANLLKGDLSAEEWQEIIDEPHG